MPEHNLSEYLGNLTGIGHNSVDRQFEVNENKFCENLGHCGLQSTWRITILLTGTLFTGGDTLTEGIGGMMGFGRTLGIETTLDFGRVGLGAAKELWMEDAKGDVSIHEIQSPLIQLGINTQQAYLFFLPLVPAQAFVVARTPL